MNKIYFITSSQGKVKTLTENLKLKNLNVEVVSKSLDILEPQFDSVKEVSHFKALKAFEMLKMPVLVEDGGLSIPALNGFPGVYTKYVLDTLGVDNILKLMRNVENREVHFISVATFVNQEGEVFQFEREDTGLEIAQQKKDVQSPYMWSDLGKIIYLAPFQKYLCELSKEELARHYQSMENRGSIQKFVNWYAKTQNQNALTKQFDYEKK